MRCKFREEFKAEALKLLLEQGPACLALIKALQNHRLPVHLVHQFHCGV